MEPNMITKVVNAEQLTNLLNNIILRDTATFVVEEIDGEHVWVNVYYEKSETESVQQALELILEDVDPDHRDVELVSRVVGGKAEWPELVGMTLQHVEELCGAYGWMLRNWSKIAVGTMELRGERMNIRTDEVDIVIEAFEA